MCVCVSFFDVDACVFLSLCFALNPNLVIKSHLGKALIFLGEKHELAQVRLYYTQDMKTRRNSNAVPATHATSLRFQEKNECNFVRRCSQLNLDVG